MKPLNPTKKIWLFCNFLFVINYSFYLSLFLVKLPIPSLPSMVNILLLIISYSTSLFFILRKDLGSIPNQPNFYCILVFLTLPKNILLLPFYFLSLYHLISFVLSNKSLFEEGRPYKMCYKLCVVASNFHVALGRVALLCKILCVPLAGLMFLFGSGSIGTFLTYVWMVRQQYQNIPAMRSVFGELRIRMDEGVGYLPENVQYFYIKARELLVHYHQIMKE